MANLLDQASIVLTPTAYDDGKVLCAKPSEPPYGDFDFSRNSAATRVNAQGLVENVQILSSNLVQNGDFSEEGVQEVSNGSFSQEGSELVTNGSFDTDSDWVKGTGWTISGGTANANVGNNVRLYQSGIGLQVGKTYLLKFDVLNYVSGSLKGFLGYTQSDGFIDATSNGSFEVFITPSNVSQDFVRFHSVGTFIGSIDNVSVKEVGQDWTLGTGWSIGEDKASSDGSQTSNSSLFQPNVLTQNKYYKFEFTLSNVTSGAVRLRNGIGDSETYISYQNSNGTYTAYSIVNSSNKTLVVDADSNFIGSITNISVKEVGQNWDLDTGWEIGNNLVTTDGAINSNFYQDAVTTIGQTYKYSFDVLNSGGGVIDGRFRNGGGFIQNFSSEGTYTGTFVAYNTLADFTTLSGNTASFSITNISVIEITDDTNLPRINYEGFSYQDALGSELVTNGGFDTDSNWSKIGNVSISGGSANFIDNGSNLYSYIRQNISQINGKKYLIDFEIKNYSFGVLQVILQSSGIANTYNSNGKYSIVVESSVSNGYVEFSRNFDGGTFSFSIDNVSVKEYLGQSVVPDSGCGSWLFEPQSTNLIPYSEDFSNADWNASTDIIIDKGYLAPDGTNNASKITADGANAKLALFVNGVGPYTKSIYARTVSGTGTIYLGEGFPSGTAVLSNVTEQWQRFEVTNTLSNFYGADFRGASTLTEVIVWGAQFEDNISYATSYIPTEGSTVTRNQDLCTNGGSLASINSTEGVLYAEIAALSDDGTTRRLAISDGSNANRVLIGYNTPTNSIQFVIQSGGSTSVNQTFTLTDATQFSKVAFKYKENDCSFWIDGVKVGIDITALMPIGLNQAIFAQGDIARPFFAKTKALAVWKEALSDEELTLLTAPAPVAPTFTLDFDEIANQFTFNRASLGTIVNEQGLIETVSNIGPELVTNGSFDTDSDWSKNSGWTISGGNASSDGISSNSSLYQNVGGVNNTIYKITGTISNYVSGTLQVGGSSNFLAVNSNGDFVHYRQWTSDSTLYLKSVNFIGSIDNVSVKEYTEDNIPRIDYSTGTEAFLLEPQSTNLITYSSDYTQWGTIGSPTITSNFGISPDGTQNSTRLQFSTNDRIFINVSASGDITFSVYLKGVGQVRLRDNDGSNTKDITLTSEWIRYEFIFNDTITNIQLQQVIGTSDFEIWGAQVEQQSYPTSYIPTSGTTVTRVGETCVDATPEINSEEGVFYAEISALVDGGTFRGISLNDGTTNNNNVIRIYCASADNRITIIIRANGSLIFNYSHTLTSITDFNKIAIKYKQNDFSLWVNGINIHNQTTGNTPIGLNELLFNNGLGTENFYGNTKDIQIFNEALSNYQLAQLTTI